MPVPKKRTSKISRNMRRSHHAHKPLKLTHCLRCKELIPPHMTCPNCGTYKGREVIDVLAKLNKQERRAKEKAQDQN